MQRRAGRRLLGIVLSLVAMVLIAAGASAMEVQLAGIRLGSPSQTVRDVYGEPDAQLAQADTEAPKPPMWAVAVCSKLEPGEAQWLYRKGDVVVGVALDAEGLVRAIAVAGGPNTAWRPHRYVKLGDSYRRPMYRYGYPDAVQWLAANAAPDQPGREVVGPNAVHDDCVLTYSEANNIAFAVHNGEVARINIWKAAQ
ncbi:MAG: hypothetical protein NTU91_11360, partial [Chloroflexi bacterium]|nr:hypothetical protein [Chloroflexota bacterium]